MAAGVTEVIVEKEQENNEKNGAKKGDNGDEDSNDGMDKDKAGKDKAGKKSDGKKKKSGSSKLILWTKEERSDYFCHKYRRGVTQNDGMKNLT